MEVIVNVELEDVINGSSSSELAEGLDLILADGSLSEDVKFESIVGNLDLGDLLARIYDQDEEVVDDFVETMYYPGSINWGELIKQRELLAKLENELPEDQSALISQTKDVLDELLHMAEHVFRVPEKVLKIIKQ